MPPLKVHSDSGQGQTASVEDSSTLTPASNEGTSVQSSTSKTFKEPKEKINQIVPRSVIVLSLLNILALWGLVHLFTRVGVLTFLWFFVWLIASGIGVTAGAHRLWSHRAYKANFPMRVILMMMFTIAGQNDIYDWARDHRLHHRVTETEADPHNASRGFFFSHMGWLMVRKHPEVIREGARTDLSDLRADPIVMFNRKYYPFLMVTISLIIPTVVPVYLWGESLQTSFLVCAMLRYAISLHLTWLVNSAAHMFGNRPYDEQILPVENGLVAQFSLGEGWHNFHHTFPWDYKTGEWGGYSTNYTTAFVHFFAWLGWITDLKTVDYKTVAKRALKKGDGSFVLKNETFLTAD